MKKNWDLLIGLRKTGGRNNQGKITVRHRGGGHKRLYRKLEAGPYVFSGTINEVAYDPNRNAYLAHCTNQKGSFYKILGGVDKLKIEDYAGKEIKAVKLKEVGVGEEVYNVSLRKGQTGKLGRASGTKCTVLKQTPTQTVIRLPSQQVKVLNNENIGHLGAVATEPKKIVGKAGINRRLGIRPTVRGAAMNAVDHPNGGKTHGGHSKTPWGKLAKWVPTRKSRLVRV